MRLESQGGSGPSLTHAGHFAVQNYLEARMYPVFGAVDRNLIYQNALSQGNLTILAIDGCWVGLIPKNR